MVTEASVPLVSFRFTSALVLNAKKRKKSESIEREMGRGRDEDWVSE